MTTEKETKRVRVVVARQGRRAWRVGVEAESMYMPGQRRTVVVAHHESLAAANEYAKGLRHALRAR